MSIAELETLKCIREVLDSFPLTRFGYHKNYTTKQYSEAYKKISELLVEVGI